MVTEGVLQHEKDVLFFNLPLNSKTYPLLGAARQPFQWVSPQVRSTNEGIPRKNAVIVRGNPPKMNGRHSGCREVIVICIRLIEFFKLGPKETKEGWISQVRNLVSKCFWW